LFGPVRDALRGCHFASDQEVKEVVHAWLVTKPKAFFSGGMQKLASRWTKCVAKEGDYVEKCCSCEFCIVVVLILKIHCGYFLAHPCILHITVVIVFKIKSESCQNKVSSVLTKV
jgi:hypothetical protein